MQRLPLCKAKFDYWEKLKAKAITSTTTEVVEQTIPILTSVHIIIILQGVKLTGRVLHNISSVFRVISFDNSWSLCPSGKSTVLTLPSASALLWEDIIATDPGRERVRLRVI